MKHVIYFVLSCALILGSLHSQVDVTNLEACGSIGTFHSTEFHKLSRESLHCQAQFTQGRSGISPSDQDPIQDAAFASGLSLNSSVSGAQGLIRFAFPYCGVHEGKHYEAFDFEGLGTVAWVIDDLLNGSDPLVSLRVRFSELGSGFTDLATDMDGSNGWELSFDSTTLASGLLLLRGVRNSGEETARLFPYGQDPSSSLSLEPTEDNTIYEIADGSLSNGSGSHLFAGNSLQQAGRQTRRALLRFGGLSTLPQESRVVRTDLSVTVTRTPGVLVELSIHRCLTSWGEGASDAPGQEGSGTAPQSPDATWLHAQFPNDFWNQPGGDFDSSPSATLTVDTPNPYAWTSTDDLVFLADGWVEDPIQNFGLTVIGDESFGGSVKRFSSRENPTPSERPHLDVRFIDRDSPVSATTFGQGWMGTLGIPTIDVSADPALGTSISLQLVSSSTAASRGVILLGFEATRQSTALDGDLYVQPFSVIPLTLPPTGLSIPFSIPGDSVLCGIQVYLQLLHEDGGASKGVSFTKGLKLTLGG